MKLEALLLNALSYSYSTASNLRTLLTEQETAYGDVDLLCHLLRLFSVDSPRWIILDFKYGLSPTSSPFYFPVWLFYFFFRYK